MRRVWVKAAVLVFTNLGSLVLGRGDEICAVLGPLQIDHRVVELVNREVVQEVAGLGIILGDGAVLVASNDVFAEVAPPSNGGLALVADDRQGLLIALLGLYIDRNIEHNNGAQVSHALLGYAQQLGALLVKLDPLDGSRELPCLEALAGLYIPQADRVVGGTGGEDGGGGVDVDSPDGTLVAVVGSQPFTVVGEPCADMLVLRRRENQVAIAVVSATQQK
jgi:hypothetical protein